MEPLATVRDLAIIFIGIESIVITNARVVLILVVRSLGYFLRYDIKPIHDSASEAARTVRGTTSFVSDTLVDPVIRASGFASGILQALRILSRRG